MEQHQKVGRTTFELIHNNHFDTLLSSSSSFSVFEQQNNTINESNVPITIPNGTSITTQLFNHSNNLLLYIPILSRKYFNNLTSSNKTNKVQQFQLQNNKIENQYRYSLHQLIVSTKTHSFIELCHKYQQEVNWKLIEQEILHSSTTQTTTLNNIFTFETCSLHERVVLIFNEIFKLFNTKSLIFCNEIYVNEILFVLNLILFECPILLSNLYYDKSSLGKNHLFLHNLIKFLLQLLSNNNTNNFNNNQIIIIEKYIISIALNHPYLIDSIIEILLFESNNNILNQFIVCQKILKQICYFSKIHSEKIRKECMHKGKFPELCLNITFEHLNDFIVFFNSCFNTLFNENSSSLGGVMNVTTLTSSEWLIFECIKHSVKFQDILKFKIKSILEEEHLNISDLCSLLRICCAFVLLSKFNVFGNDFRLVIENNVLLNPNTSNNVLHLVKLRFCYLFICGENILLTATTSNVSAPVVSNTTTGVESAPIIIESSPKSNIVSILRDFIKNLLQHDKTQMKNILLLLATNFHADLYKSISNFIIDTLFPIKHVKQHHHHRKDTTATSNVGGSSTNVGNVGSGGIGNNTTTVGSSSSGNINTSFTDQLRISRFVDESFLKRQLSGSIAPLFTNELFPVEKLAREILTVLPLPFYTNDNDYVLQCVFRMLKSKLFRKHNVDASEWVLQQIKTVQSVDEYNNTLHPLIPKIVKELIDNCIPHVNMTFEMKFFTDEQVLEIFQSNSYNQITRSLILYYILTVNNTTIKHHKRYGPNILDKCNVVEVVKYIQEHRKQVGIFYSQLLSVVEDLQYLFHLETLLSVNEKEILDEKINNKHKNFTEQEINETLNDPIKNQYRTRIILDNLKTDINLCKSLQLKIINLLNINNPLGFIMNFENVHRYVLNSFKDLWKFLFSKSNPMKLSLQTINALSTFNDTSEEIDYLDIYQNILLLFKIDQRVFYSPPLLDIFLQILSLFMTASRKYILQLPQNDNLLKDSLIKTQESSILQLLLDYMNPKLQQDNELIQSLHEDDGRTDIRIIQRKICQFIHQRFIENPDLSRLIHFQTYDPSLLPITVSLIDSIHVCMDFIEELLRQPKVHQQMFAVQLASYLCEKYPLHRYIESAKSAINRLKDIAYQRVARENQKHYTTDYSTSINLDFYSLGRKHFYQDQEEDLKSAKEILESLVRIAKAFPFLCLECIKVVHELKNVYNGKPKVLQLIQQYFTKLTDTSSGNM
ncbi:hypothetical protein ABK040_016727 [Willaertia magna]